MSKAKGLGRATQKIVERAGTEISYMVGNATEKS